MIFATLLLAGCGLDGIGPAIVQAEPDVGSARGGDEIRLVGRRLPFGARVFFGAREAAVVRDEAPDAVVVRAPPGFAGRVELRMLPPTGEELALPDGFLYEPLDPWFVDAPPAYLPDPGAARDVAVGDLDADGDLDLVLALPGGGTLLRNTGRGAFELFPPAAPGVPENPADPALLPAWAGDPRRVVLADLNGDGRIDLFVCHGQGEQDRLFFGSADGALRSLEAEALPARSSDCLAAFAVDLDGDGRRDLALLARDRALDGALRSTLRVLLNRGPVADPRFVLHEGLEPPGSGLEVALPDGTLSWEGATEVLLLGTAWPDQATLRWVGATPGATLRVSWAPTSSLRPTAFELPLDGVPAGASIIVVATDAQEERFTHERIPSGSVLRIEDLGAGVAEGGDGLLTPPLHELSFALRLDGDAPAEGAVTLGVPVLETADGGRLILADFAHPAAPFAAPLGEAALRALDLDGDTRLDLVVARSSGGGPPLRLVLATPDPAPANATPLFAAAEPGRFPGALDGLAVHALLPLRLEDDDVTDLFAVMAGQDRALRNDGAGWFFDDSLTAAPVDAADGVAGAWADLDRDGRAELLIANDGGADRLLHPDGAGRLVDWTARAPIVLDRSALIVPVDVDGDGDVDLITWGPDRAPRLLVQVD